MIKSSLNYAANVANVESKVNVQDDAKVSDLCDNEEEISCLLAFIPIIRISVSSLFNCKKILNIQLSIPLIHSDSVLISVMLLGDREMYSYVSVS